MVKLLRIVTVSYLVFLPTLSWGSLNSCAEGKSPMRGENGGGGGRRAAASVVSPQERTAWGVHDLGALGRGARAGLAGRRVPTSARCIVTVCV